MTSQCECGNCQCGGGGALPPKPTVENPSAVAVMNPKEWAAMAEETPYGDKWSDPCCLLCVEDPWHQKRYGTPRSEHSWNFPGMWVARVPKCDCDCHLLRWHDPIHSPKWMVEVDE